MFVSGTSSAQRVEEGFVPLFNGKDLTGWTGDAKLWRVEGGEIIGSTKGNPLKDNSFLFTERQYADFELRVSVKLINNNSGIQFRSEKLDNFVARGYQADVAEQTYFGMLYEEKGRGFMDYWKKLTPEQQADVFKTAKLGDWNTYEIACVGDRITMKLNGKTTCDIVDPSGSKSGFIALQLHVGPEMEVRFKDISIKELAQQAAAGPSAGRGARFRVPEGFAVEEVANESVTGSAIAMTFDHEGRPLLGVEGGGIRTLIDRDGNGTYDEFVELSPEVKNSQGVYELDKGVYLVQGSGPEDKTGVYRISDPDGDLKAETVELVLPSDRGMGEHGPHSIHMGADGFLYVMYGNHSYPDREIDPNSPLTRWHEDDFLPRYWDPRGHAVDIYAPGGTVHRTDTNFTKLELFSGGYRNAYDFDFDASGEMFTYDSDMEWDVGLPWYRDCRVAHLISGAEYGWRSGSSNKPVYYIESLPSVDDTGRGSPVGVAFYDHHVYPAYYQGALFLGDWSRGRVRVLFPQKTGATFTGDSQDFVAGEPLNVTDLDVGPDGSLYVTTGGRRTHGGLYRIRYTGAVNPMPRYESPVVNAIAQPMPRSAWGKQALRDTKAQLGDAWAGGLEEAAQDRSLPGNLRMKAIEAMQVLGPQPSVAMLTKLASDPDAQVRAAAVYLLGTHPLDEVRRALDAALLDADAVVARRSCEAVVRAGVSPETKPGKTADSLFGLLDHSDRFTRHAARLALQRISPEAWKDNVLKDDLAKRPHGALEGMIALFETPAYAASLDTAVLKVAEYARAESPPDTTLDAVRVVQLAIMRAGGLDQISDDAAQALRDALLPKFPHSDWRVNREIQVALAGLQTSAAIDPMLTYLEAAEDPKEQIHSVYALRAISDGWSQDQRKRLVAWFDKGWEIEGGVSLDGYVNNLWQATLELLSEDEKTAANAHRDAFMAARRERALSLMTQLEEETKGQVSDLAQRDFTEIAEYLEYDPMAYRKPNLAAGEKVFLRSRCADCHLFGSVGRGGGPDLTTLASRFTRRDMLEAIMYPSKVVSDQYTAVDVELNDGMFYTGMVQSEDNRNLTLLTPNGTRVDVKKNDIATREPSTISVMPEGLLETMNFGQLVELIQYLESGSKAEN
jgi:putative heme-binding domain-containing protein